MLSARGAGKQPVPLLPHRRPSFFLPSVWPAPRASSSSKSADKAQQEWQQFSPTVEELFQAHSAFYDRSFRLQAAREWQQFWRAGWRPDKRPGWELGWWSREQGRGRVEEDGEVSSILAKQQKKQASAARRARRSALSQRPGDVGGQRGFSTSSWATAAAARRPVSKQMYIKGSYAQVDSAAGTTESTGSDVDRGRTAGIALSSDSDETAPSFLSPGEPSHARAARGWGSTHLAPGSMVQFSTWGHRTRAIFLASTGTLIIVIDGSGECHMRHSNAVDFVLNNVVPTSVAMEAFKTVSLANSEITNAPLETLTGDARRARVACVHALSRVEMQQEHATAELVKAGAARMHAFLLDKVENTASMTWESHKGVEWLLGQGKSTPIRVWAMHDMLVDDPDRFVLEATAPRTSTFRLRSKASVNAARQVQEWLSNDSHIIKQFIDKARQVISLSRQNPPTPTPLALRPIPHHLAWAKEETVLLALIRSTAASSRSLQGAPGEHHVAALMKMTGLYKEFNQQLGWPLQPFDRRAAVLFLRELGVLPPWQSPTLFDRSVHISKAWPIPTLAFSPEDATQKSFDGQPTHHKPVVEERHCADRLGDVRRDFGDMPVYVIDDASARELDDGISVESIDDDSAWLHVHVADPTATLTVNGYAAKLAAFRMTSIYNLGIQLPMLSTEMVESEGWSLGGGSGGIDRAGQRTLTFSARIDRRTGEILEHRVEAGVIRNVNILTYTQVAEIIGWPTPERVQIRVGPEPPGGWPAGSPQRAACSPEDVANLKLLEVYHDALKRSRMASGSMEWFVAKTDVKVHAAPIPVFYSPPAPRLWQGMPSFSLSLPPQWNEVDRLSWSSAEAQPLVSEFMILAGRVAALFSRERGLVMPYRGQLAPDLEPSALAEIKATAGNTGGPSLGACDFISIARHRVNLAAGAHSPSPIQHFPLGLQDGYVRATSPLRRYGDLAVHWSIKRALHPKNSPVPPAACLRPVEMRNLVRLLDSKGKDLSVLEGRFNAAWIACGIKETMRQLATDRAAVDPVVAARFDNLFGIVLQDAMLWSATNVIAIRMILPELGVRASLMSDGTEHWHKPWLRRNDTSTPTSMVGLSVPVKILSISADDHVAVRLDKSRMHELHMIP